MELPNESASFVVIFVLFCFVFIQDEFVTCALAKNTRKAFFHVAKIYCLVMTLYEVFNRLQAFLFFLFWGINVGMEGKRVPVQSTGFLLARGSFLKIIWKRASYFQLFKISWLLQKQITCNGIFYLLELMNLFEKHLCIRMLVVIAHPQDH